ncbi:MAG: hypothetical protein GXY77_14240 [Fibrobacter sp.]|nr:hypothetical protein [Fibrobacter sp.]
MKKCMELTLGFNYRVLILIGVLGCMLINCNGDHSCNYTIEGYVKNAIDSLPIENATVIIGKFDYGSKYVGLENKEIKTDQNGFYVYHMGFAPQYTYYCPEASEIEMGFSYIKSGFQRIDTIFSKGQITGEGSRHESTLIMPLIFLKE